MNDSVEVEINIDKFKKVFIEMDTRELEEWYLKSRNEETDRHSRYNHIRESIGMLTYSDESTEILKKLQQESFVEHSKYIEARLVADCILEILKSRDIHLQKNKI